MAIKYVYVDDEQEDRIIDYVRALNYSDELDVENIRPTEFGQLINILLEKEKDGVLLDWRLDQMGIDNVHFKASSIAQGLRTKYAEKDDISVPIVLISTDERLSSYYNDETSHDLFDELYDKLKDVVDHPDKIRNELISLANGYQQIKSNREERAEFFKILGLNENKFYLDPKTNAIFSTDDDLRPTSEYAQFILKELIKSPGPLIDEDYLAAKLGVDMDNSDDWNELKENELVKFKYSGPFGEGWDRWWSIGLENWWQSLDKEIEPLQLLEAKERVDLLKESFALQELESASPIEEKYSTEYWTICQVFKSPLAPSDGFKIRGRENFPWQEKLFISSKAAREKKHETIGFRIHPSDKERFSDYLKNYEG